MTECEHGYDDEPIREMEDLLQMFRNALIYVGENPKKLHIIKVEPEYIEFTLETPTGALYMCMKKMPEQTTQGERNGTKIG